jgi:hypothetical protein
LKPLLWAFCHQVRLRRRALAETGFPHARSRWSFVRPRLRGLPARVGHALTAKGRHLEKAAAEEKRGYRLGG